MYRQYLCLLIDKVVAARLDITRWNDVDTQLAKRMAMVGLYAVESGPLPLSTLVELKIIAEPYLGEV